MKNDHRRQPDLNPALNRNLNSDSYPVALPAFHPVLHPAADPVVHSAPFAAWRASLLAMLLACSLGGCDKKPGRPLPPQAPPKPQAAADDLQIKLQRAVFTYSSRRPMQYQKGSGSTVEPVTIQT